MMHRARTFRRFLSPHRLAKGRPLIGDRTIGGRLQRTASVQAISRRCVSAVASEQFMNGTSSQYIEDMYHSWLQNPTSVHKSWDSYFRAVQSGAQPGQAYRAPPGLVPAAEGGASSVHLPATTGGGPADLKTVMDHLNVQLIIRSYQTRGHNIADLDPLGIASADLDDTIPPELELETYGLTEADLQREFLLPMTTKIGGDSNKMKLSDIVSSLKKIYCSHMGVEYMHVNSYSEQNWLRERFETPQATELSPHKKKVLFKRLIRSTRFEEFLAKKWPSEKRFGLEGCEVLIPGVKQILDSSSEMGVENFVIGMPHRGRLNVLSNVCRQPLESIFSQFSSLEPADEGSGDVKYHLGVCINRLNRESGKPVKIAVVANPSHLEAVDPIVQGKTRAEQFYSGDHDGKRTMSILMHGDAAFAGQGVVYETFHLADLPDYTTHGTIHIVVNNQIGFTTDPRYSRSSPYCTDVARVVGCPIFHVNADDPEAVMHVCSVAAEWRSTFMKDCVIDLVCYRRHGHNELDEPMFTQPLMYQKVKETPSLLDKYSHKIVQDGVADKEYIDHEQAAYNKILEEAHERAQKVTFVRNRDWLDSPWDDFFKSKDPLKIPDTGLSNEQIHHIADAFCSVPADFKLHRGLTRTLKRRKEMVDKNTTDWSFGEALAFGSLLQEGIHVRLSGQDVERGTFSHRHHVLHDQDVDKKTFVQLKHLSADQAPYTVCNSSLSEYAVLGFEHGFSMSNPHSLVIWEAQFGDFSNTAQVIIDQFLSSGQSKWIRQSGLVMLLPHGYEGMGPEHSSARPERFLQMCNDDDQHIIPEGPTFEAQQLHDCNWIVANCTTPAQIFHILRRQVVMPFRKPLIVFSPKSLLKLPEAMSPLDDFGEGTRFQRLIPDQGPVVQNAANVHRLVFCSGKVYYALTKARESLGLTDQIALCRVEQVSPFPYDCVRVQCEQYPNAELVWAQEEHKNMGAWSYVKPRFQTLLRMEREVSYAGRQTSSSPATGSKFQHNIEQRLMLSHVLGVPEAKLKEMGH